MGSTSQLSCWTTALSTGKLLVDKIRNIIDVYLFYLYSAVAEDALNVEKMNVHPGKENYLILVKKECVRCPEVLQRGC